MENEFIRKKNIHRQKEIGKQINSKKKEKKLKYFNI